MFGIHIFVLAANESLSVFGQVSHKMLPDVLCHWQMIFAGNFRINENVKRFQQLVSPIKISPCRSIRCGSARSSWSSARSRWWLLPWHNSHKKLNYRRYTKQKQLKDYTTWRPKLHERMPKTNLLDTPHWQLRSDVFFRSQKRGIETSFGKLKENV